MEEVTDIKEKCFSKDPGFEIVKHHNELKVSDIIKDMSRPDYCSSEGFVVVFSEGTRVKFKYDEYVKLHKIVSDFKPKNIVELMKAGGNVDELISSLPDEFRQELMDVKIATFAKILDISTFISDAFSKIKTEDKKTFAMTNIKEYPKHKHFLFEMHKIYYQHGLKEIVISPMENDVLREMIYDRILEELE